MSDWQIGDEARVVYGQQDGPRGFVTISAPPRGKLVEVEYGDLRAPQHEEVPLADLERACAGCMEEANYGRRIDGEWMCATCVEFAENLEQEVCDAV